MTVAVAVAVTLETAEMVEIVWVERGILVRHLGLNAGEIVSNSLRLFSLLTIERYRSVLLLLSRPD